MKILRLRYRVLKLKILLVLLILYIPAVSAVADITINNTKIIDSSHVEVNFNPHSGGHITSWVDQTKWHIDVNDNGNSPLTPAGAALNSYVSPYRITLAFSGTPFSASNSSYNASRGLYVDASGYQNQDETGAYNAVVLHNASIAIADGQIPTFTASRTDINTIRLNFSEPVKGSAITNSFTVAGASSVSNTAPSWNSTIILTTTGLSRNATTVSYNASLGNITDNSTLLNEVANGGSVAVGGWYPVGSGSPGIIEVYFKGETLLKIYFDKTLDVASTVDETKFSLTDNNGNIINITDNSAVVSGSALSLTIASLGNNTGFSILNASQGLDIQEGAVKNSASYYVNYQILNTPVYDWRLPVFTASRIAVNTIVLNFSEPVNGSSILNSFTVTGSSSVVNTAPVANNTIILTTSGLNRTVLNRTVNYNSAIGDIVDLGYLQLGLADGGNVLIVDQLPPLINITSWGNDFTNDQNLSLTLDQLNKNINFNISTNINSDLTVWNVNGANQSHNFNNLTYDFTSNGNYNLSSIVYNSTYGNYDYKNWTLISDQVPILINITSWGNNFTNNQYLSLTLNQLNTSINFNISTDINSDLTIWNVNGANQSHNFNNLTYDFSSNGNYNINSIVYNSTWGIYDYKNWTITVSESSTPGGSVTQDDLDSIRSELNGLGVLFINFMISVLIMNKKN